MYQTKTIREKIMLLFTILLPILITQVGMYSMNFFDTVMSGHAGADDLAGVAIGSSLWVPVFTGLSGILLSLTPIISHLIGSGEKQKIPHAFIQSFYLSILIATLIIILGFLTLNPILNHMGLMPDVKHIAQNYLIGLAFGMIPLFIYTVLRCFIDALGQTKITMWITLSSLPVNIFFNYLLIFGKMGFPRLGGAGAGYASGITYWVITIIALVVIHRVDPFSKHHVFKEFFALSLTTWKEQLKIGVPIGFAIFFEVSIFSAVTLLMSKYNTVTIAGHQAAINFASLLYMMPFSMSMALTISIGFEVGGKRYKDAKEYSYIGMVIAVIMAVIFAIGLFIFNGEVARLYSSNLEVIRMTRRFLIYAIFFQLSDAIGAPIQGALRGYKDVNVTLIMALISYWLIGLPSGYILAQYTDLGPFGYWLGLICGLATGAVTLYFRLKLLQRKYQHQKFEPI